ncbi:hypothetical protein RCZ04_06140 [Capnocytophaga sp. HP1101]
MTTFFQIVIIVYLLYYAGNILYDLYFKKEKQAVEEEDKQEFSLSGIEQETKVTNIDFSDVEELATSSSTEIDEKDLFPSTDDESATVPDEVLNAMMRKHQEEEQLDSEESNNSNTDTSSDNTGGENTELTAEKKQEFLKDNKARFKDIMNMAETSVQVVVSGEGEDGIKVYKASVQPK